MEFWAEIVGQADAVRALEHASSVGGASDLSHAWLITGPPGSGRSNLAFRFAAALIAQRPDLREQVYGQVVARTHPDLGVVTSQKVQIGIDEVRGIVQSAHYSPSQGRHRVIVIEDADRMPERTSNVLLKALEEPPERTIWILCAPSEADLLPTIRSRVRSVRLVTPAPEQIAGLLHERDGVPVELAERAARLAQSHIGMARRLATDTEAMARRERTIEIALDIVTLSDAMRAAATLAKVAADDAAALAEQVDTREREEVLRGLGVAPGAAVPAALRSQVRQLEELQKRRATRQLRDGIDRILTDLLSLHRDVLLTSLDAGQPLVNAEVAGRVAERAERVPVALTLDVISAIEHARERIARNVTPQFVLEALFATQISGAVRSAREGIA
ncbi:MULTISPECIES: DNA polymerase III subunit delta' [unclassified Leucobacter]|uniref:DNA polymerase III subunit delta' n=1 Tax=unclassified Leucobacter TaxID=2621730 RepID=UPI00165DFAC6|nr:MULTISPECIES: DNA polymerase III subunit delta' [unclassified Leucobacter]MBC9937678.1 DNA polymerase III subunit delta' [Leucobacter sp. cx-87]